MKRLLLILMLIGSVPAWSDGEINMPDFADTAHHQWSISIQINANWGGDDQRLCTEPYTEKCQYSPNNNENAQYDSRFQWTPAALYYIKSHRAMCDIYGTEHDCTQIATYRARKAEWESIDTNFDNCISSASGVAQLKQMCRMEKAERRDMLREVWGLL